MDRVDPLIRLYHGTVRRADRRNARRASRVLVNSEFMREAVARIYGLDAHVSYLGVDSEFFRPLPAPKGNFVLSVGSLTPLKGFEFLIGAMGSIPENQRPPLVIASNFENPPERDYLQRLAAEGGVDLRLLSRVGDDELVRLYNEATVVAYAAVREPFGLVPLEAMACGTPVVAVREGGVLETVVHEVTGLLVERETKPFAAALSRLLADPQLAAEYGRQGRELVLRRWSWEEAARRVETEMQAVLPTAAAPAERAPERIAVAD